MGEAAGTAELRGMGMENEKPASGALVPIEEVDSELLFEPGSTPTGPRKICRTSILNQLSESHRYVNPYDPALIAQWKLGKAGRRAKVTDEILKVVRERVIVSRYEIGKELRFGQLTIAETLDTLVELGFLDEGIVGTTHYYRIAE